MDYTDPFTDFLFNGQPIDPTDPEMSRNPLSGILSEEGPPGPSNSDSQINYSFAPLSQDPVSPQDSNFQNESSSDNMPFDVDFPELTDNDEYFQFEINDEINIPTSNDQMTYMNSFQAQLINDSNRINQIQPNLIINEIKVQEETTKPTNKEHPSTSGRSTRSSKRKVDLSTKSELFKNAFYRIFTTKKKFPKHLVKEIHDFICQYLPFHKMKREHIRRIDLYFDEYSKFSEIILSSLQQHKEELLVAIPELSNLK